MVKLTWEKKAHNNSNLIKLKKKYSNFFKDIIDVLPPNKKRILSKSKYNGWKNKIFWGENLEVLYSILNDFEEKIDLIYVDPPFFSGVNYRIEISEENKVYDTIAYMDSWQKDLDSYLQMLYERIILFQKLLSQTGIFFIHLDWHASHYVKIMLDEIFGENKFVNNIIWYYYNKFSAGKKNLPRAYDNILVYSKSKNYTFNEIRIPRKKSRRQLVRVNVNGVLKNAKDEKGHVKYRTVTDKKLDDVWKIPCLQPASKEWTGFPTQKHHALLERIIKLGSNEGDLVADFFCGSGTTLLEAEKLKRKWIGSDISEYSIYLSCKRLLNYQKNHQKNNPFDLITHLDDAKKEILNTGFFQKDLSIKRKK
ncbi:MAG: DNA methyltransferase [Promethearchaeota archaeon]|jgi:adenine specific DNA methylase Mod